MTSRRIGFVGGGRVTRILMGGFERAGRRLKGTPISDPDEQAAGALKSRYPDIVVSEADCTDPASQDIVFGALHPATLRALLPELGRRLRPDAVFVSLAPKLDMDELLSGLGGFRRVVRMIPNAPSIIGRGFNPVAFSADVQDCEQCELLDVLGALGECPVVEERALEAYAIVSGMGSSGLWFQLQELAELGVSVGLSRGAANRAALKTGEGAAEMLFSGELPADEVMGLVPVRPVADNEDEILRVDRAALGTVLEKLTRPPVGTVDETGVLLAQASSGFASREKEPTR